MISCAGEIMTNNSYNPHKNHSSLSELLYLAFVLSHSYAHTHPVHKDLEACFQKWFLHHHDHQTKVALGINVEIMDFSADLGHISHIKWGCSCVWINILQLCANKINKLCNCELWLDTSRCSIYSYNMLLWHYLESERNSILWQYFLCIILYIELKAYL